MKLLSWGNQGNLYGIVIITDISQYALENNLIFPFINKVKLDKLQQSMILATINGTFIFHYAPFMYVSIKRAYRNSVVNDIAVFEDLNMIVTFSKKIEVFSLITL